MTVRVSVRPKIEDSHALVRYPVPSTQLFGEGAAPAEPRLAMRWSDIQFHPPSKTLRQFAGLWLACFGGLAAWEGLVRGHGALAAVLAVLALAVGPLGLIQPWLVRPIYVAWMVLAFPIGWTISQVILALIFYGLFTPIGLLFRLIGRDPLHRARRPGLETYWTPKAIPTDPRRYFKQF